MSRTATAAYLLDTYLRQAKFGKDEPIDNIIATKRLYWMKQEIAKGTVSKMVTVYKALLEGAIQHYEVVSLNQAYLLVTKSRFEFDSSAINASYLEHLSKRELKRIQRIVQASVVARGLAK